MGCDIHCYMEIQRNGTWEKVGDVFPYPYHDPSRPANQLQCYINKRFVKNGHKNLGEPCNDQCYNSNPTHCDNPIKQRSYATFSVLANVRNGYGSDLTPISEPRGLPDDVTDAVNALSEDWGGDGHSHSHLTLRELLEHDWGNVFHHIGGGSLKITHEDIPTMLRVAGVSDALYPQVEAFLNSVWEGDRVAVNALDDYLKEHGLPGLNDSRIVFWFDN